MGYGIIGKAQKALGIVNRDIIYIFNEGYTLVIKPAMHTNGDGKAAGVYINLRETDSSQDAPVMYVKNATYLLNAPF